MSVSSISTSSFTNGNVESIPTRQQPTQQQFLALAQQLQSGNLSPAQTAALQQQQLQTGATSSAASSTSGATPRNDHVRAIFHHHLRPQPGDNEDSSNTTTPSFGQLGQSIQAATSSTAQRAYGSLTQDLQQVALNSDLLGAQSAALQESALSVSA